MLLHDRGGGEGGLETVRGVEPRDNAERAERLALPLPVVRERLQPPLHEVRRPAPVDDRSLLGGEVCACWRRRHGAARIGGAGLNVAANHWTPGGRPRTNSSIHCTSWRYARFPFSVIATRSCPSGLSSRDTSPRACSHIT